MGWLDSMVLRSKLLLLSAVLLIGLVAVGLVGVTGISTWAEEMELIGENRLPMIMRLSEIDTERLRVRGQTFNVYQFRNYDATEINGHMRGILDERKKSYELLDPTYAAFEKIPVYDDESKKLVAQFAYYVVFPFGFAYLVNFGENAVTAKISMEEYLGFFLKLIFGFGVSFELPVFCFFLAQIGLITDRTLIDFFRYAIVLIFVFAAILTPPDILTQTLMALPLILLYALSILIVKAINPAPKIEKQPIEDQSVEEQS